MPISRIYKRRRWFGALSRVAAKPECRLEPGGRPVPAACRGCPFLQHFRLVSVSRNWTARQGAGLLRSSTRLRGDPAYSPSGGSYPPPGIWLLYSSGRPDRAGRVNDQGKERGLREAQGQTKKETYKEAADAGAPAPAVSNLPLVT